MLVCWRDCVDLSVKHGSYVFSHHLGGLWMKKHHLCSDNGKIVGWDPVNGRVGPNALGEEPTVHGSDKDEP